jgi:hypothetical protein
MKTIIIIILTLGIVSCTNNNKMAIRTAIENQLSEYPNSELRDIYKNFFQDFYGPGHLLENKQAAIRYFDYELEKTDTFSLKSPFEYTGYKKNFVRVDLYLIKAGVIPRQTFLKAFFESAEEFQLPILTEWDKEWNMILKEVENLHPDIPNLAKDKLFLLELLKNGQYVIHHSEKYIEDYNPHYRIISTNCFNKYLKELITKTQVITP